MRKSVISLSILLALPLVFYSLSFIDVFKVRRLGFDPFSSSIASIERFTNMAWGANILSPRFRSLKRNIEALGYVRNVDLISSSFLEYDVVIEYEDGLVLTDGDLFFFYSERGIFQLYSRDVYPLLSRYIPFLMTSEMLNYLVNFPIDREHSSLLALLMDISRGNGYNENLIGRAEYSPSSGNGFGELRLYSRDGDFILIVSGAVDLSFLSSSLSEIGGHDFDTPVVFEIRNNTLIRRLS